MCVCVCVCFFSYIYIYIYTKRNIVGGYLLMNDIIYRVFQII